MMLVSDLSVAVKSQMVLRVSRLAMSEKWPSTGLRASLQTLVDLLAQDAAIDKLVEQSSGFRLGRTPFWSDRRRR
jgi:hypothetical protein